MYYKYTLLKDLPDAKAGTSWTLHEPPEELKKKYHDIFSDKTISVRNENQFINLKTETLKNPEWFKREIDERFLMEIKCPTCGETHGRMYTTKEYKYVWDDDAHENVFSVWFEFACGHGTCKIFTENYYR